GDHRRGGRLHAAVRKRYPHAGDVGHDHARRGDRDAVDDHDRDRGEERERGGVESAAGAPGAGWGGQSRRWGGRRGDGGDRVGTGGRDVGECDGDDASERGRDVQRAGDQWRGGRLHTAVRVRGTHAGHVLHHYARGGDRDAVDD